MSLQRKIEWAPLLALAAGGGTLIWAWAADKMLLYGDATAHLAIARRMVDSATPGLGQWGTVWLPLPHLLMTPLVLFLPLWRNGVAGAAPALGAFVVAAWMLHRIVARNWGATAGAWAAVFFCWNPSLLYLAAVPMTETVYLAAFLGLVDACDRGRPWQAGVWGMAATLCRYDGWFALAFALPVLAGSAPDVRGAWSRAWRFCALAGAGPALWLLYNWWYLNDALSFATGPYSARQIYLNALRHGGLRYPGDHALRIAALYFLKTVVLTCGVPLAILALWGVLLWRRWRGRGAAWMLLAPLPWYLWAMWSGNVPIFVPQYWPHGYYNLRYGVQMLPAVALFSALAVSAMAAAAQRVLVPHLRLGLVLGLAGLCAGGYAEMLRAPGPVTYAEAEHNAPDRLAMEHQLAKALKPRQKGERVLMYYGTYPGALADDGIAVREVVQESNFLLWQDALFAPHRHVQWVVVEEGSPVAKLVNRRDLRQYFHQVAALSAPYQHAIEVYRRNEP
ncbi:MAG TPA: hypothetical protein VN690_13750 [Terriglobales bacterium]|nr:hypothetical protein [Terriglobales bacterium]